MKIKDLREGELERFYLAHVVSDFGQVYHVSATKQDLMEELRETEIKEDYPSPEECPIAIRIYEITLGDNVRMIGVYPEKGLTELLGK